MADFVAVLRKTIDGLGDKPTPEMRARVYDKARSTIAAKLAAINPPPPAAVAERQKRSLEEAIAQVESEYAPARPMRDRSDPLAELEQVFASLQAKPEIKPAPPPASSSVAPASSWTSSSTKAAPLAPSATDAERAPKPSYAPAEKPQPVAAPARDLAPASRPVVHQPAAVAPAFTGDDDELPAPDDGGRSVFGPGFGPEDEPRETQARKRNLVVPIAAAIALLVVAGGSYAVWLNKDDFAAMLGLGGTEVAATPPQQAEPAPAGESAPTAAPAAAPQPDAAPAPAAEELQPKFTQRLNADGTEVDEGPAGGVAPTVGEGTTVAAATQPSEAAPPAAGQPGAEQPAGEQPADAAAPATEATGAGTAATAGAQPPAAQVAVGQKAIYYEERTSSAQGSAESGSIVWSVVRESPGGDAPPEPAIRGEATIPAKDLQLRMTIRRNADQTLPASHIIELIFLTPEGFGGGGIENILRFALKDTEEAPGNPLIGMPAKIADGYFLIALNDSKAEIDANLQLLGRQNWIDIPVIYKSGRRALITMEKGIPGEKAFEEAIKAWQAASAG
ncbi:hypothetical protein RHIZO_03592 [Rhizobiaceae bacterium]|nr:hypothetical protein RHIZO_03592 [Rhizobiaceae bacterium]